MKFLYMQNNVKSALSDNGIFNLHVKAFDFNLDRGDYIKKTHHHNDFELHFIQNSSMTYEVNSKAVKVDAGSCILIPPATLHKIIECDKKISITFKYDFKTNPLNLQGLNDCVIKPADLSVFDFIVKEEKYSKKWSATLIENRLFELIITLFRNSYISESDIQNAKRKVPAVLNVAKEYIKDNIESFPQISDVALYCHISERHLSRIFLEYEGISTFDYMKNERLEAIKILLADKSISLKEISERMNFGNEYYFNTFFKAAYGMPPGAYRKML